MERDARRKAADWTAGVLAVAILALGGLLVLKPAIDNWDEVYRADPFETGTSTQTVKRQQPGDQRVTTTTTRTEASASGAERVLGKGGLLFVRLAAVSLAAFLAAAVLQRAILGNFALAGGTARPARAATPSLPLDELPEPLEEPAATRAATNGTETAALEPSVGAVGRLLASRREELGLSQRELGKRAGISHTVISRIESGQHAPSAKTLERLAEALR
jgi:HTH-type transcriptional regulator/antitoxin HipB